MGLYYLHSTALQFSENLDETELSLFDSWLFLLEITRIRLECHLKLKNNVAVGWQSNAQWKYLCLGIITLRNHVKK